MTELEQELEARISEIGRLRVSLGRLQIENERLREAVQRLYDTCVQLHDLAQEAIRHARYFSGRQKASE